MALKKYSEDQIQKLSMIEIANKILSEKKEALNFIDLFEMVAEHKQFSEAQREGLLGRFYTDLNVDGRFTTLGSNLWGLKRWYPVDQTSEKSLAEARKREQEDEDEDEELEEVKVKVDESGFDVIVDYEEEDEDDDDEFAGFQVKDEFGDN